jgi:hypothetical protein
MEVASNTKIGGGGSTSQIKLGIKILAPFLTSFFTYFLILKSLTLSQEFGL